MELTNTMEPIKKQVLNDIIKHIPHGARTSYNVNSNIKEYDFVDILITLQPASYYAILILDFHLLEKFSPFYYDRLNLMIHIRSLFILPAYNPDDLKLRLNAYSDNLFSFHSHNIYLHDEHEYYIYTQNTQKEKKDTYQSTTIESLLPWNR